MQMYVGVSVGRSALCILVSIRKVLYISILHQLENYIKKSISRNNFGFFIKNHAVNTLGYTMKIMITVNLLPGANFQSGPPGKKNRKYRLNISKH